MGQKWFYSDNGREAGPFSLDQLKWLVANKRLSPDDLVWKEGMADWVRAAEIRELFSADKAIRIKPPPPLKQAKPLPRPAPAATLAHISTSINKVTITICQKTRKGIIAICVASVATVALCCGGGLLVTLIARRNSTESQTLPGSHPRPDDNNSKRISLADSSVPEALNTFFENALTSVSVVNEIPGLPRPTTGPHGEPLLKKEEAITDDRLGTLKYTCFYEGGDPDKDLMHGYARSWYKNGRLNQITFYNNGQFIAEVWWDSEGWSRNVVMRDRAGYYHMAVVNMRPNGGRESTKKAISATNKTVRGTASIEWVSEVETRYHMNGAPWRVCRWRHGRPIDNITYNADGSLDGSATQFIDGTFFDRGMAPLHVR